MFQLTLLSSEKGHSSIGKPKVLAKTASTLSTSESFLAGLRVLFNLSRRTSRERLSSVKEREDNQ